mmetsp:Transcript_995/g.2441  ORF Transcript_995/g.2441 Transcript_995/m.2441 type:complete len:221 (-) Transcript_995:55-717(-)
MWDETRRRCQMGNKYAYAYLLEHAWVSCARNMPGARMLRKTQDAYGNFWYSSDMRHEVRSFYKTCVPTCASNDDTYHAGVELCLLSNDVARVFLQGDGQKCQGDLHGASDIRRASKQVDDGNFWYKPEMADRVRTFYASCSATCALGDPRAGNGRGECRVHNSDALRYLKRGGNSEIVCDRPSPGRTAISSDGQGGFKYLRRHGMRVEAWYTSCMRQPTR